MRAEEFATLGKEVRAEESATLGKKVRAEEYYIYTFDDDTDTGVSTCQLMQHRTKFWQYFDSAASAHLSWNILKIPGCMF